jgi:hypothetical protein
MAVLGVLVGFFGGLSIGAALLLLLGAGSAPATTVPTASAVGTAATADIEAVVDEVYINRIMVESANDMSGPVSLAAGKMDLRDGGVADFAVALKVGPLNPVFEGVVGFRATDDGSSIEVLLLDVQLGRLRLKRLVPKGVLADINADIKRMLVDKIGSQGLSVLEVRTDDSTLRLFLGREGD